MRLAVLVAPYRSPWLDESLARLGFEVVVVDGDRDIATRTTRALADVTPDDTVLLHLGGRLADDASLRTGATSTSLRALSKMVAAKKPLSALVIAELTYDDGDDDPLIAVGHVEDIRGAVDPRATGHAALVAVRAQSMGADPLAFTRLFVRVAEKASTDERGALLSEIVEQMRATPESYTVAQSHAFVPGLSEIEIAPVSEAPALAPLLALADGARDRQAWNEALAGYRAALLVPGSKDAHADVYARIGGAERALGRDRFAKRAFQKHVDLARVRIERVASPTDRAEEYFALAQTIVAELRDLPVAVDALEKARALDPVRDDVLEALRRSYRVLERWPELIDVTGALAEQGTSATERAARRVLQAKLVLEHLRDETRAIGLLETALRVDPTQDEALDLLASLRPTPTPAQRDDDDDGSIPVEMTASLPLVDADLIDVDRIDVLESHAARILASGISYGENDHEAQETDEPREGDEEIAALEAEVATSPLDIAIHARLFELHLRAENIDRAYLAALALEELGLLGAEQQALLDQNRPDGLRARKPIDDAAWARMRPEGSDDVIESLFAAIARAAIAARTEQRRAQRKLPRLDPSRKQPPTSTASVVRSFHWAARSLGMPCPDLYVMDEVPGGIAAVPSKEPATAVGPDVVRGRSTKDLAFLAGRHLTYYRPEHALLVHFPTREGLTALVLAAVQIVMPAMPVPLAIAPTVSALRQLLARHLSPDERAAMTTAVRRLDARGGKLDLPAWTRSVELLAGRAGFLLSGDLRTAMSILREETRAVAGVSIDEKRADLLAFAASRALADLRVDFAITGSHSSAPAPRHSSGMVSRDEAIGDWMRERDTIPPQSAAGG